MLCQQLFFHHRHAEMARYGGVALESEEDIQPGRRSRGRERERACGLGDDGGQPARAAHPHPYGLGHAGGAPDEPPLADGFINLLGSGRPLPFFAGDTGHATASARQLEKLLLQALQQIAPRRPAATPASNLFAFGVDSLTVARLAGMLAAKTGVAIGMEELHRAPTIRELAALVCAQRAVRGRPGDSAWRPGPARGVTHAMPAASNLAWLIHAHHHGGSATAPQTRSALVFKGRLDVAALRAALADVIARHEALRTTYEVDADGHAVQTIHAPWRPALPLVPADPGDPGGSGHTGAGIARMLAPRADGWAPMRCEPSALPLVGWTLVSVAEAEHVLLQTAHRFVLDEWSSHIIVRDLARCYNLRTSAGGGVAAGVLAPPSAPFSRFCAHQRQWLASHDCATATNFWRGYLRGAGALLELRGAQRRGASGTPGGRRRRVALPHADWAAILSAAGCLRLTPFRLMFALFSELVGELSGRTDFLVGTEVANRSQGEFHETVGMIANLLPVRIVRAETDTWRAGIERHAASLHRALSHQGVPLPAIVAVADLDGRLVGVPPVQICFSFHHAHIGDDALFAGLEVEAAPDAAGGHVEHELGVSVTPPALCSDAGELALVFAYRPSIYYDAIVDSVIGEYVRRLRALGDAAGR